MYFSSICLQIRWWYYPISIGLLSPFLFPWAHDLSHYWRKALPLKYISTLSSAPHFCFTQSHHHQDLSETFVWVCSVAQQTNTQTGWYRRLGDWNNRTQCSYNSGAWKSKVKVPAGLISDETSLSWHASDCLLTVSSHGLFFPCVPTPGFPSLSCRSTSPVLSG